MNPELETEAKLYVCEQVKVIYLPKYHCELNPIEGLWCLQKQFIRSRTDQTFNKMMLLDESRQEYINKNLNQKLIRRFWRALDAYNKGDSYFDVLTRFFGNCKEKVESHRKISNKNVS